MIKPKPDLSLPGSGTSLTGKAELPDYAPLLAAQHSAHWEELQQLLSTLPIQQGDRIIDAPCGDGTYSRLLAQCCGREGRVLAVDTSLEYLQAAEMNSSVRSQDCVQYLSADVYALPLREDSFDFAWCAQSFMSLPQPVKALQEFRRIVKPGGSVAALEQDQLHWMILPWPPEMEIAIHRAERAVFRAQNRSTDNLYFGRHLRQMMRSAGLTAIERKTCSIDRQFPLPQADQVFLRYYFSTLWNRIQPHLAPKMAARIQPLIDPEAPAYLPRQRDFEMTCNYVVSVGRK